MPDQPSKRDQIVQILTDEGGAPGSSLHSWRCEHPDRYGECDCLKWVAMSLLPVLEACWDEGWHEHYLEWQRMQGDPEHAITKTNPYRKEPADV